MDDSARARPGCFLAPIPPLRDTNHYQCNHSVHDRALGQTQRLFGPIERLAGGFRDDRKAATRGGHAVDQGRGGTELVPAAIISPRHAQGGWTRAAENGATERELDAIFAGRWGGNALHQKREPGQACGGGHRQARPYRDRK